MIPIVARTVRAAVLAERELDYVDAARVRTENAAHIMFREILPNIGAVVAPSSCSASRSRSSRSPR